MSSYIILVISDDQSFYLSAHSMDMGSDYWEDAYVCDHPNYFDTALEFYEEPFYTLIKIPVPDMEKLPIRLCIYEMHK